MQVTLQAGQHLAILRCITQLADQAITVVEQVPAFLDKDVDQLAVVHAEVKRIGIGTVFGIRRNRRLLNIRRRGSMSAAAISAPAPVLIVPRPGASSISKNRTGAPLPTRASALNASITVAGDG